MTRLADHLTALLLCCDLLEAAGDRTGAREVRRALVRATIALHALREELLTIEIVERYLRAHASGRERPPPS